MNEAPTLSVLVPVYNEVGTILTLINRVRSVPISKEIIIVDDASSKRFFSQAAGEMDNLMYRCYAQANKDLTYTGQNLAAMAPVHSREVADLIRDYWNQNYWTEEKKSQLAEKLIKSARLKKAEVTK